MCMHAPENPNSDAFGFYPWERPYSTWMARFRLFLSIPTIASFFESQCRHRFFPPRIKNTVSLPYCPTQHLRKEEWASVSQKDNSTRLARTVQKDSTLFIVDIAVSRQEKKQFNSSSSQGKRKVSTPNTTGNAEWSSQESTPSTIGK